MQKFQIPKLLEEPPSFLDPPFSHCRSIFWYWACHLVSKMVFFCKSIYSFHKTGHKTIQKTNHYILLTNVSIKRCIKTSFETGFQNGISWTHSTKTHKLNRCHRNGLFPDQCLRRGGHCGLVTNPTIQLLSFTNPENYSMFRFRKTHRLTFSISLCMDSIIFCIEIYTFHYNAFCHFASHHSITSFAKN